MICTFFGHGDTPQKIEPILKSALVDLIENRGVRTFYVGNQGNFDSMARKQLKLLKAEYPHINYAVVLAYMPSGRSKAEFEDYSDTIFPDGLENTHPRYALDKRNRWMADKADYVVTYVTHSFGGAAKFKALSEKKGKIVINLAGETSSVNEESGRAMLREFFSCLRCMLFLASP